MKNKNTIKLTTYLLAAAIGMYAPAAAADVPPLVVGRVFHVEGRLLRYVPEESDWVAMVQDAPFGTEDTLFSGNQSMAELIVPNGTWIRVGFSTQIQFLSLESDLTEVDVAAGEARIYNKGSRTVIKATCPFGYVLADPGTVFDFYVGDESVEVIAVQGRVSFVHSAGKVRYDVAAGSPSLLADRQQLSSGEGTVDPDWNRWNLARDDFWAGRARAAGQSAEYLPPSLRDEAYVLEEHGRWERVPYEGTEYWFWRPTTVVEGWSPYTVGRWTDWYGDQTWIPAEPFGYITHHYGNWIYTRNRWYWAPPVTVVHVSRPLLNVGFFWFPGRVAWIHRGTHVGWVPLAPHETYYCRRPWGGPRTIVVNQVNITHIHIDARNYTYIDRAIVVNRGDFYRVSNYQRTRVTNISRTVIINYQPAPVISDRVITNYTTDRQRYNFTNVRVTEKPHRIVINRIQQNRALIREGRGGDGSAVQERAKGISEGRISREARIEPPKVTNYVVPAREVNRPKDRINLQQREIRRRGEGITGVSPGGAGRPGAPSERFNQPSLPAEAPGPIAPARPGRDERRAPEERPERTAPAMPGQAEKPPAGLPAPKPERVVPARPGHVERALPAGPPTQTIPARPGQIEKTVPPQMPERSVPALPGQVDRPGRPEQRPERMTPAMPGQTERSPAGLPLQKPELTTPAPPAQPQKSAQPERPTEKQEHTAPARPGQVERALPPLPPAQTRPAQPGQIERTRPSEERPDRGERRGPPEQRLERTAPAIPSQTEKPPVSPPAQKLERTVPTAPAQPQKTAPPERPAEKQERQTPAKEERQKRSSESERPERLDRRGPTNP